MWKNFKGASTSTKAPLLIVIKALHFRGERLVKAKLH